MHRRHFIHVLEADDRAWQAGLRTDFHRALGDVLGEVADTLEVSGDADRTYDLAQVDGHGLASRDHQRRRFLDLALQYVEALVRGDDLVRKVEVDGRQGIHRIQHHLLGNAPHLRDLPAEQLKLGVEGLDCVVGHDLVPQPKRPVM